MAALLNTPIEQNPLIEILSSSTHGQGIYAKVDLKKGQRILEEIPLLAEPKDTSFQGILSSFNSLSTNDQSEFLNFHAHASGHVRWKAYRDFGIAWAQLPEHVRKVVSTYETNAFDDYGVARIATRINHSCVPNTEIYLHDVNELSNSKKIMQLNAIRDIKAGEELFFAYTGTMFVGTKERQKSIQNWGFQCACEACQDTDEAKAADTLREMIGEKCKQIEEIKEKMEKSEEEEDRIDLVEVMEETAWLIASLNLDDSLFGLQ